MSDQKGHPVMRVACLSDTHGSFPTIEGVDAVFHAGDLVWDRHHAISSYRDHFYPWVEALGVPVYATFGNHDHDGFLAQLPDGKPDNLHIVVDELRVINGVSVWFSPWSVTFGYGWVYMDDERGLGRRYRAIPEQTEVIVSHGPPYRVGDYTDDHTFAGSRALKARAQMLPNLQTIITGHIHEGYGQYRMGHVHVLNVSHMNAQYEPVNAPVVIELMPRRS